MQYKIKQCLPEFWFGRFRPQQGMEYQQEVRAIIETYKEIN